MDVLPCGHAAHEGEGRLCPHLVGAEADTAHYRLLRGRRLKADFICANCDDQRIKDRPPELIVACEGCVDRVGSEVGAVLGWRGSKGSRSGPSRCGPSSWSRSTGPASPRPGPPVSSTGAG